MRWAVRLAALLAARLAAPRAQVVRFALSPVPQNFSVHVLYLFYIYAHKDSPEQPLGDPFVRSHNLQLQAGTGGHLDEERRLLLESYQGIQAVVMTYEQFWAFTISNARMKDQLCCTKGEVVMGRCQKDQLNMERMQQGSKTSSETGENVLDFVNFTIRAPPHQYDVSNVLHRTGIYVLMLSNCGPLADLSMTGTIVMKNPYGFLPGNEYHKLPFYGWLLCIYFGCAAIWAFLSVRWWKELLSIHHCISAVILFGLCESLLWYVLYQQWNANGSPIEPLRVLAIFASALKSVYTYMLVLVAALGWGVTMPYLDRQTTKRIASLSAVYLVTSCGREFSLANRHSTPTYTLSLHSGKSWVSSALWLRLTLVPIYLINAGLAAWFFTALAKLMTTLRRRKQTARLRIYNRLWFVVIFLIVVSTISTLLQVGGQSKSIVDSWHNQWLFEEGITHLIFLGLLASIMYLWAPHKYSQRYAYSESGGQWDRERGEEAKEGDDEVDEDALWTGAPSPGGAGAPPDWGALGEEGDVEAEEDGESFWASTREGKLTEEALRAHEDAVGEEDPGLPGGTQAGALETRATAAAGAVD